MAGRTLELPPINQIFKYLQSQKTVSIWLFKENKVRITGTIKGFDEFMNLTVDDANEIDISDASKFRKLGMIMIKGENISLISEFGGGN